MEATVLLAFVLVVGSVSGQTTLHEIDILVGIIRDCRSNVVSIYDGCSTVPSDSTCHVYTLKPWLYPTTEAYGTAAYARKNQAFEDYQQYCSPWCSLCFSGTFQFPTTPAPPSMKCEYSSMGAPATASPIMGRILNGRPARQCQYPWMVAIRYSTAFSSFHMCAGVLRNGTSVITSKTCANILQGVTTGRPLTCVVGEHAWDISSSDDDAVPCHIVNTNSGNGIAELRLDYIPPHYMVRCIAPACFQNTRTRPNLNNCVIAAWGSVNTSFVSGMGSAMQYGPAGPVKDCSEIATILNSIIANRFEGSTDNILCNSQTGTIPTSSQACIGDQGGALMCTDRDTGEMVTVGVIEHGDCRQITWFREIDQSSFSSTRAPSIVSERPRTISTFE